MPTPNVRKLRAKFKVVMGVAGLFLATVVVCVGVFLITRSTIRLISPLTKNDNLTQLTPSDIVSLCSRYQLHCQNVQLLQNGDIKYTLDTNITVFLTSKKNINDQLASLQKIRAQLTIKGKQVTTLDFRFDQVVVTF